MPTGDPRAGGASLRQDHSALASFVFLSLLAHGVCTGCAGREWTGGDATPTPIGAFLPLTESMGLPAARQTRATSNEIRVAARVIYVWEPTGDADFLTEGHGAGLGICYFSDFGGEIQGDMSAEFVLAQGQHKDVADQAGVSRFALAGFRWLDHYGDWLEPYLSFGVGYYAFEASGGSSMDGGGFYAGGGVEFVLPRALSATVEVIVHSVWADDSTSSASQVVVGTAALSLRF